MWTTNIKIHTNYICVSNWYNYIDWISAHCVDRRNKLCIPPCRGHRRLVSVIVGVWHTYIDYNYIYNTYSCVFNCFTLDLLVYISAQCREAGVTLQTIMDRASPPSEFWRSRVILDCRYGMCDEVPPAPGFSQSFEMTCDREITPGWQISLSLSLSLSPSLSLFRSLSLHIYIYIHIHVILDCRYGMCDEVPPAPGFSHSFEMTCNWRNTRYVETWIHQYTYVYIYTYTWYWTVGTECVTTLQ